MGYIHEFEQLLAPMLSTLDEVARTEVMRVVKTTVVESYRNGIEAGKAACLVTAIEQTHAPAGHGSHTNGRHEGGDTPRGGADHPQRRQPAGTSRVIEDAAMERIADDITAEVMDVMAMYRHNGGEP